MSQAASFRFRLYVAGDAENSLQARANLAALCQAHVPNRHEIDIVDVFVDPRRALADGIFMMPTLVRLYPLPVRKIVGTLNETDIVLRALGLGALAA